MTTTLKHLLKINERLLLVLFTLYTVGISAQTRPQEKYDSTQRKLATGWNTWNTKSVLSHVLLPEGLAVNLIFKDSRITEDPLLTDTYISQKSKRPETITPGLHAHNGSYTELVLQWKDIQVKIESASNGRDLVLLITPIALPARKPTLIVEAAMLWNKSGVVKKLTEHLEITTPTSSFLISGTLPSTNENLPFSGAHLSFVIDQPSGFYTGKEKNLKEIEEIIQQQRNALLAEQTKFGKYADTFTAIQSVIAWNTIYEADKNRVVTPVSRFWNTFFGSSGVLFCWDTYFGAYLASIDNKALAYANVVEVTKGVKQHGMVPNYVGGSGLASPDRSQPPVGSIVVKEIFRKYREKWFLEVVFDDLLVWNRWWPKHRENAGFLSWGSDYMPPPYDDDASHNWQGAAYESGLDNSPMYEQVPFNKKKNVMELADVGLTSLYIADCKALAEIAQILGKEKEARELNQRGALFSKSLKSLWNNQKGFFYNKRTDTNEYSNRISPTNFYPLLAGVATQKEAEEMISKHYFNEEEFYGEWMIPSIARNDPAFTQQDYWRGRIWAPLNFLVYLGMRNYKLDYARNDLATKSDSLLMGNFRNSKSVHENYHGISGEGLKQGELLNKSDSYYHWGGLLGLIALMEAGYVEGNEKSLVNTPKTRVRN